MHVFCMVYLVGNYVSGFADDEDEKAKARKGGESCIKLTFSV